MNALVIALGLGLLGAPAAREPSGDAVLDALDAAFAQLRAGNHTKARRGLERATRRFDELALDGSSLEKAFASDANKPYRGRPHERVLAEALLAALDMERGRCDLALPALRQAAFLDVKANKREASDAVLVHALALRCLIKAKANDADVERARADLKSAAGDGAAGVERAVLDDNAVLALDGVGPTMREEGESGERAVIVPSTTPAPAGVVGATPERTAARIRLGRRTSSTTSTTSTAGLVVWSSTVQASTVGGRPFDDVLRDRAAFRSQSMRDGTSMMQKSVTTVKSGLDVKHAVAGILFASAGAGLTAISAATDARADARYVDGLFERVVLVADSP